jgi:hypothetical protein
MSDSDVRVETVANDREVAEIERLQSERRFGLAFGSGLEPAYQRDCQQRAAAAFRYGAVLVLLLYVLLGAGIYILLPERDTQSWLTLYSGIGGVLLVAGALSHVRRLERPLQQVHGNLRRRGCYLIGRGDWGGA